MDWILVVTAVLLILNTVVQLGLEGLNIRYARRMLIPFPPSPDPQETPQKAFAYLTAKSRLTCVESVVGTVIFALVLFSGVLAWCYEWMIAQGGDSVWIHALYLFAVALVFSQVDLPFDGYRQFVLEARFGFNKTTQALWWKDRLLAFLLALLLFYPLLVLVLWMVGWTGSGWWLWVWIVLMGFQLLMLMIVPNWIMPLFNSFSPMEEDRLKERLHQIAQPANVEFESIRVMDGSKRSTHSNAFLSGLGRFKKIALFDTLLEQLNEDEIVAVTAHELGHYARKHILKRWIGMSALLLLELFLISWLIDQPRLVEPFGFEPGNFTTGLLLISLLSGWIAFWLNPLENYFSRRHEYEADAFSLELMQDGTPLISALQTLEKANLSNPAPHPLYSCFYYSHPTVQERVHALQAKTPPLPAST